MLAGQGPGVIAVAGCLLWRAWRSGRHFAALDAELPEAVRERPPWRTTLLVPLAVAAWAAWVLTWERDGADRTPFVRSPMLIAAVATAFFALCSFVQTRATARRWAAAGRAELSRNRAASEDLLDPRPLTLRVGPDSGERLDRWTSWIVVGLIWLPGALDALETWGDVLDPWLGGWGGAGRVRTAVARAGLRVSVRRPPAEGNAAGRHAGGHRRGRVGRAVLSPVGGVLRHYRRPRPRRPHRRRPRRAGHDREGAAGPDRRGGLSRTAGSNGDLEPPR